MLCMPFCILFISSSFLVYSKRTNLRRLLRLSNEVVVSLLVMLISSSLRVFITIPMIQILLFLFNLLKHVVSLPSLWRVTLSSPCYRHSPFLLSFLVQVHSHREHSHFSFNLLTSSFNLPILVFISSLLVPSFVCISSHRLLLPVIPFSTRL